MPKKIIQYNIELCKKPYRQGVYVVAAEKYITGELKKNNVPYSLNRFTSVTPACVAKLVVDGKEIPCQGTCYTGGNINSKSAILSSTIPSRYNLDTSNVNFNPYSDAISCSNFYFAPAIAVSRKNISKVIMAKSVKGKVTVKKIKTNVAHIMVGNTTNPKNIVFAHYDSINTGAIDNGSGVAVSLYLVINRPDLLKDTLFVFDPHEELSFTKPTYWGEGFRVFQRKFPELFAGAEKLVPIDCVGYGKTIIDKNPNTHYLAFPITDIETFNSKIVTLHAGFESLMSVYHSAADLPKLMTEKFLQESARALVKVLEK